MSTIEERTSPATSTPALSELDASTWFEVRKRFLVLSRKITENYLKQLDHVAKLQEGKFPHVVELLADCEVPDYDVEVFIKFGSTLRPYARELEEHAVPPVIINALIRADDDVRDAALQRIRSGYKISINDFPNIKSSLAMANMSAEELVIESNKESLRAAFAEKAKTDEDAFRADAAVLYNLIVIYANQPSDNVFVKIRKHSRILLRRFEELFGSEFPSVQDWLFVGLEYPEKQYLAQAHYALSEISKGSFRAGFPWLQSSYTTWFSSDSIRYLAGISVSTDTGAWRKSPDHLRTLTAIQVGADCGGMTLGLEAARFNILAVTEPDFACTKTLKKNRPKLGVESVDIRDFDGLAKLAAQRTGATKLDMLAGNLNGPNLTQVEKLERLNAAIDCITAVKPRAFFFQIDAALYGAKPNLPNRKRLHEICRNQGYSFDIFDVRASDVQVAQEMRVDTFIIGMKNEMWRKFTPPGSMPRNSHLGEVLFDHAFPYRSDNWGIEDDAAGPSDTRDAEQQKYDRWARNWLRKYGDKFAPRIIDRVKGDEKKWTNVGLTMSLHDEPLNIGHDDATSGKPLPLTFSLLALLNGFPVGWHFPGKDVGQKVDNLTKAVPPAVAHAVAIALRTALTGEELDHMNPQAFEIGGELPAKLKFKLTPEASSNRDRFLANEWRRAMIEQAMLDQMLTDDDSEDD